ncbi:MAG TPA: hypothetical protein VIH42_12235 [Thermoguttaceae bacterium]
MAKKRATTGQSIQFDLTAKMAAYVNDLMDEEGFGNQPASIVQAVFWEGIRALIDKNSITRRPGKIEKD